MDRSYDVLQAVYVSLHAKRRLLSLSIIGTIRKFATSTFSNQNWTFLHSKERWK